MTRHRLIVSGLAVLMLAAACSSADTAGETTTTGTTVGPAPGRSTTSADEPATSTTTLEVRLVTITCEPGTGADFSGLAQTDARFDGETLRCATFDGGSITGGDFGRADATGATFRDTTIRQTRFDRATLVGADFSGASLDRVRFTGADLTGAELATAELANVRWEGATCPDGAVADQAGGTCVGHLEPVAVEVSAETGTVPIAPVEVKPLCPPDSGRDFTAQVIDGPDYRQEDLRCARFVDATVNGGDFSGVDASAAIFDGATLTEPVFDGTTLVGASFAETVFSRARFRNANLIGADITTADLSDTRWTNTTCPNGVNSEDAGGTCLGSRNALDLPEVDFNEIRDSDITVRQGGGLTTYSITNDVLFGFNDDTLTSEAEAKLAQVIASIMERFDPGVQIQVIGHADAVGEPAYNLDLSQRRADNVAAVLEASGDLDEFAISAIGLGERQPIAPNTNPDGSDNPEGRALNRRVEIVVRAR